ncbi:MAG TPA: aldo/keto reductase [Terrimesophilobacter sp.]|nr:aldo/keto reductase [Terrimesophilobacter sp.]HRP99285.1 aldo/keto reductase [Terrimesophilobacter sp.]
MTIPLRALNDSHSIPALGFGTYKLWGDDGIEAVQSAIEVGYRLLDTALNYDNEADVAEGIRRSGVAREDVFVTTKLPGRFHGYEETLAGFEESRTNLGVDYVDLYLIHWPMPRLDKYIDSFRAMAKLQEDGLIRSIGVSNFTIEHLDRVLDETGITPAVNQVELHPYFPQAELREYHRAKGITTQSWTPLARQRSPFKDERVLAVANAHGVTSSQAILRWHIELGSIPIPKAAHRSFQEENTRVFDFELSEAEIASISSMESGRLWGGDPDTNEEM